MKKRNKRTKIFHIKLLAGWSLSTDARYLSARYISKRIQQHKGNFIYKLPAHQQDKGTQFNQEARQYDGR